MPSQLIDKVNKLQTVDKRRGTLSATPFVLILITQSRTAIIYVTVPAHQFDIIQKPHLLMIRFPPINAKRPIHLFKQNESH
jgi:hypothetical protein